MTRYYWGCSENIRYGLKVSEEFLDAAERDKGTGLREQVNLQNLQAGRVVLEKGDRDDTAKMPVPWPHGHLLHQDLLQSDATTVYHWHNS